MSLVDDERWISIGISQNATLHLGQHTASGRFDPQIDIKVDLHKNIDYATARAYEQYYIEKYSTIDRTNTKANQQNLFRYSRMDSRGMAFEEEYQNIKNEVHQDMANYKSIRPGTFFVSHCLWIEQIGS